MLDWNKYSQFQSPLSDERINAQNIPNSQECISDWVGINIYSILYNLVTVGGKNTSYSIWSILIHMGLLRRAVL